MSRQNAIAVENNFVKGFITENTALSFPPNAVTETDNVVYDATGRVTRRLGFDTEASYTTNSISLSEGDAYTSFIWEAVGGDGDISFLVVQAGSFISFYDISSTAEISGNKHPIEINLDDFLPSTSMFDPAAYNCQFSYGNGDLFVVNPVCETFFVEYSDGAFTSTQIDLKYRDFEGLDDGLEDTERPTATVAGIETSNPNHLYNLYNQGWTQSDALTQWDTARTDLPSNCDFVALYRVDATDAFADNRVTANDPGNRLAPKGHFILDVPSADRQQALDDEGFTFTITTASSAKIDSTLGTVIGDLDQNSDHAFDDDLTETTTNCAAKRSGTPSNAYVGKDYSATPQMINKVAVASSTDDQFVEGAFSVTIDFTLYGKNGSAPANGTDGTSLGTLSVDESTFGFNTYTVETILSTDPVTEWDYVWVYANLPGGAEDGILFSEIVFYSSTFSFQRPSSVAFYAGRVFYGGISAPELSNNVYFSQIIEKRDQYGKCFQVNDPSSENFPDLLPNDGGVIKIPEMGTLQRLYSYQNALLCFANNGIWLIQGTAGSIFKADDYVVKRISAIGMNAPLSVTSVRGLPAWWGDDGIYTVTFDPSYDSFTPTTLTLGIIDTFYESIPSANKKYVKGTYDELSQIAYWLYSSDTDLGTDAHRYDSMLCFDTRSKAFYTWTISDGPVIRTIDYIKPADRSTDNKIKYLIHRNYTGSAADQTFAEQLNTNYLDWEEEGTNTSYTSYFVTGYRLDGQTQKFFQPNYVFVFLEQEDNASCFMQARYDFTTSSSVGKWSSTQQVYNENLLNRNTNFRRLKVRGKGRALQLYFESEEQKPFTIIGWSIFESTNSGI